jgi:hypothetical protein
LGRWHGAQLAAAPAKSIANFKGATMNLSMSIGPVVALIAGILILLIPRLLNYIVAVYLIVIGLIGLLGTGSLRI